MNVSEFLQTKTNCPFCNEKLIIGFSDKKPSIKYKDNRFHIMFDMKGITRSQKNYKVGYSLSLEDNSFYVELFRNDGVIFNEMVPVSILNTFKGFHNNTSINYFFDKKCKQCNKYSLITDYCVFDFGTQLINDIKIEYEEFIFVTPINDEYKIIVMCNYYDTAISTLYYWRDPKSDHIKNYYTFPNKRSMVKLPLIPFISAKETLDRLNGLLMYA